MQVSIIAISKQKQTNTQTYNNKKKEKQTTIPIMLRCQLPSTWLAVLQGMVSKSGLLLFFGDVKAVTSMCSWDEFELKWSCKNRYVFSSCVMWSLTLYIMTADVAYSNRLHLNPSLCLKR